MKPEVTAADLTDEEIDEVARDAVGSLYLDCLDATTAAPYEARSYSRWVENRDASRARVARAINARRRG